VCVFVIIIIANIGHRVRVSLSLSLSVCVCVCVVITGKTALMGLGVLLLERVLGDDDLARSTTTVRGWV